MSSLPEVYVRHGDVPPPLPPGYRYQSFAEDAGGHWCRAVQLPEEAAIALWVVESYQGDAAFVVHSPRVSAVGASALWEGMRSYFLASRFIRRLASALAQIDGSDGIVLWEHQEEAGEIWSAHAHAFLRAMYAAHGDGKVLFSWDSTPLVIDWLRTVLGREPRSAT